MGRQGGGQGGAPRGVQRAARGPAGAHQGRAHMLPVGCNRVHAWPLPHTRAAPMPTLCVPRRLVGDCDFEGARSVAGAITPVPGGVGPMTITMLLRNTVDSGRRHFEGAVADDAQPRARGRCAGGGGAGAARACRSIHALQQGTLHARALIEPVVGGMWGRRCTGPCWCVPCFKACAPGLPAPAGARQPRGGRPSSWARSWWRPP